MNRFGRSLEDLVDQRNKARFSADLLFLGGLGLMILSLPISEFLKNVGYFLALGGWIVKRAGGRGFRVTLTPLGIFLGLYFLTSLLSAAFAIDRWEGLRGVWDVFRPLSLFLMMINDIDTVAKIRLCLWFFIVSTGIGIAWGFLDYFSGSSPLLGIKSLGHPNHTAWYLVIMLTLLLSLLLMMDWSVQAKIAIGILVGATFLALFLTYSRGAWMAFVACLLFLSISLKRWKPVVVVALLTMAILVSLQITGRLWTGKIEKLSHLAQDDSLLERFRMWRGSVLSLQDHPLLGVGPRNFKNLDPERYGLPTDPRGRAYNHAHNLFFTVMVERGLLGLLSLLALLTCYAYEGIKRHRRLRDDLSKALWHAAMGSFIAIVVAGIFNTTLHSEGATAFWSITALMLAAARPGQDSPSANR